MAYNKSSPMIFIGGKKSKNEKNTKLYTVSEICTLYATTKNLLLIYISKNLVRAVFFVRAMIGIK